MTRLIGVLIIVLLVYGGYRFYRYYQTASTQDQARQKEAAAAEVQPEALPGLPYDLEPSLKAAQQQGAAALRKWLQAYAARVQDPRLAWIELDFCEAVFRDNPSEARRVFAAVKNRTPPTSPVWPRIQQVAKSYE
jgi:hypothetical protein